MKKLLFGLMNVQGLVRCLAGKTLGQAVDRSVAASLKAWFSRFRGVRGFRVEIASREMLDSEIVDEGEDEFMVQLEVDGDLKISRSKDSKLQVRLPPVKQEDMFADYFKQNMYRFQYKIEQLKTLDKDGKVEVLMEFQDKISQEKRNRNQAQM